LEHWKPMKHNGEYFLVALAEHRRNAMAWGFASQRR
jgi:hypothetical protein